MTKSTILFLCAVLLVLLWLHSGGSKLADLEEYERSMRLQTPLRLIADLLIWILPPLEGLMAVTLIIPRTRRFGFYGSFILLLSFTIYIGLIITGNFPREPCSCGGIIRQLNWRQHFVFNLFFLAVSVTGIFLQGNSSKYTTGNYP
jgi:putative oxidoreductase